jgi:hypothetical protein
MEREGRGYVKIRKMGDQAKQNSRLHPTNTITFSIETRPREGRYICI